MRKIVYHVPFSSIICFALSEISSTFFVEGIALVYDELEGNGVELDPTYRDYVASFDTGSLCFNLFIVIVVSLCWAAISEDKWENCPVWVCRFMFFLLSLCALVSYILVIAHIFIIMAFIMVFSVATIIDIVICPFVADLSEDMIAEVEKGLEMFSKVKVSPLDDFSSPSELDDEISKTVNIDPYCDSAEKVWKGVQLMTEGVFIIFFTSLHISYNIVWLLKHYMCLVSHSKKVKDDHSEYILSPKLHVLQEGIEVGSKIGSGAKSEIDAARSTEHAFEHTFERANMSPTETESSVDRRTAKLVPTEDPDAKSLEVDDSDEPCNAKLEEGIPFDL